MDELKYLILVNGKIKEISYKDNELSTYEKEILKNLRKEDSNG